MRGCLARLAVRLRGGDDTFYGRCEVMRGQHGFGAGIEASYIRHRVFRCIWMERTSRYYCFFSAKSGLAYVSWD